MASRVGPTELPQTVAAFHSLVGLAAAFTGAGEYIHQAAAGALSPVAAAAIYLATFLGGITTTGSAIAFGKLNGNLSAKPWALPKRNFVNAATLALNAWCARPPAPPVRIQAPLSQTSTCIRTRTR